MRAGVVAPAFLFAFFADFKLPRIEALGRWVNSLVTQMMQHCNYIATSV